MHKPVTPAQILNVASRLMGRSVSGVVQVIDDACYTVTFGSQPLMVRRHAEGWSVSLLSRPNADCPFETAWADFDIGGDGTVESTKLVLEALMKKMFNQYVFAEFVQLEHDLRKDIARKKFDTGVGAVVCHTRPNSRGTENVIEFVGLGGNVFRLDWERSTGQIDLRKVQVLDSLPF